MASAAVALILASEKKMKELGADGVKIRAVSVKTRPPNSFEVFQAGISIEEGGKPTVLASKAAFEKAAKRVKNSDGKGVGFFQIGGGIAGDFPICVVPMLYQDMEMENIPFWSYFCQISDSTTSYGSYSGAVPNEKITWGKLDIHTPKFIVESDATIVAPLMFAYILGW